MLAVHALWSPGRGVLLWAEDGDRPASSGARSLRTARPHPFAADPAALTALHPGKPATLTLLLPSGPGGPVASPELVRARPHGAPRAEPVNFEGGTIAYMFRANAARSGFEIHTMFPVPRLTEDVPLP